ncbi:hypothetical protein D3C73_663640 [compost metagenome]
MQQLVGVNDRPKGLGHGIEGISQIRKLILALKVEVRNPEIAAGNRLGVGPKKQNPADQGVRERHGDQEREQRSQGTHQQVHDLNRSSAGLNRVLIAVNLSLLGFREGMKGKGNRIIADLGIVLLSLRYFPGLLQVYNIPPIYDISRPFVLKLTDLGKV